MNDLSFQNFDPERDVSHETLSLLHRYEELLVKWQKAVNLVSPATIPHAWQRHFIDSAQVLPLLPDGATHIADLGCGGGFPGLVLAMINPALDVSLIESDEKKCLFMKTVSRETGVKVTVINKRIENAYNDVQPQVITARALASLDVLLDYVWRWVEENPDIVLIFLKGERAAEEIEVAHSRYNFAYKSFSSKTDPRAQILRLSQIARKI